MRLIVVLLLCVAPLLAQEGRTRSRLLYSFEKPGETAALLKLSDNSDLTVSSDNGITHGSACARWVVKKGAEYGTLEIGADARKNWREFDYFALDVFAEEGSADRVVFELWDPLTKGYPTRCTFESEGRLRPGRQTLLFPINRAARNAKKEGRTWDELEAKDKIDLNALTRAKLFLTPPKDRDSVVWIDNLRLLQEDAAKPKLDLGLPRGAIAFKFGSAGERLPGFTTIAPGDPRLLGKGLTHGGTGWPDALTGTFVVAPEGGTISFRAAVPNGLYAVQVYAGPIYRQNPTNFVYRLKIHHLDGVTTALTPEQYYSTDHFFRFLKVDHDGDPARLWEDYIARMYPVTHQNIEVIDGTFRLEAVNHFLSAVVMIPGERSRGVDEQIAAKRRDAFTRTLVRKRVWPSRRAADGALVAWLPEEGERVWPWSPPRDGKPKLRAAGVPGQRVALRLAATSFVDAGPVTVRVRAPGESTVRIYDQRFRSDGEDDGEMMLMPTTEFAARVRRTKCLWFWLEVPSKPGIHEGVVSLEGKGIHVEVPITVEAYPFALDEAVPLSLGMYYAPRSYTGVDAATRRKAWTEQVRLMRELGMTGVQLRPPTVLGLGAGETVRLEYDTTFADIAREVGMGRHPGQYSMGGTLSIGRAIGRRLPGSLGARVDREPGIELRQPEFRARFLHALGQYKEHLASLKFPVAVEVVDEPREVPNPWNRNLADTITYARLVREAGLTGFVTPMSDSNGSKDYSVLADEVDILSIHGWKASEKLLERALARKRTLWLYNTGMDRFTWGFYPWRVGAVGRWEWHFSWLEDAARGGYPGREWYNPFTASHGLACDAPLSYPGGILFQSRFYDVAEGINDYRYLLTLRRQLRDKDIKGASAFLAALERVIPRFPELKGLAGADDGALVGMGARDEVRKQAPVWRDKIAGFLKEMK